MLHAEIERQRDPFAPGHGELGIVVDEFLDAGETLAVDVDETDDMTCGRSHRIDAAIFVDEADAGESELVNLALLLRRKLALDADEAPALLDARAEIALVDVGEDARNLFSELVRVDHAIGVGEKSRTLDVGREQPAAAIEDIGTMDRRGDVEDPARAGSGCGEAERDEPHCDQGESKRKSEAGKTESVAAARAVGAVGAGGCGVWSCGRHG